MQSLSPPPSSRPRFFSSLRGSDDAAKRLIHAETHPWIAHELRRALKGARPGKTPDDAEQALERLDRALGARTLDGVDRASVDAVRAHLRARFAAASTQAPTARRAGTGGVDRGATDAGGSANLGGATPRTKPADDRGAHDDALAQATLLLRLERRSSSEHGASTPPTARDATPADAAPAAETHVATGAHVGGAYGYGGSHGYGGYHHSGGYGGYHGSSHSGGWSSSYGGSSGYDGGGGSSGCDGGGGGGGGGGCD